MNSKILYVSGMKNESEFANEFTHSIRKCGIPSSLQRDDSKSEMGLLLISGQNRIVLGKTLLN
jgi:hypothetical protein